MTGSAISLSNITKTFGLSSALQDVSLAIDPGEFMTLVGPSGCGKSTLLKLIAGLDQPDRGAIHIGDRCVNQLRPSLRNIAMVFQNYALYPHMRVSENLAMPLVMGQLPFLARMPVIGSLVPGTGTTRQQIDQTVAETARMLGIEALMGRKPGELSGGQRQRVALGRAMVRRPGAFLMDEPLSNLDAALRAQVRTELIELQRRLKATFLYVTHDQVEAMTMSGRIAVMMDGEIVQVATPSEVYAAPADIRVARFIGSPPINIIRPQMVGDGVVALFGKSTKYRMPVSSGTGVQLGIRPEDVTVKASLASTDTSIHHAAQVRLVENLGNEVILHLDLQHDTVPRITARLPQRDWLSVMSAGQASERVQVVLPHERFLIFSAAGHLMQAQSGQMVERLEAVS